MKVIGRKTKLCVPFYLQTRLPGELAQELEGIASDFENDLLSYQQQVYSSDDSEQEEVEPLRPLRNFPALGLITAMTSAIEVSAHICLHPTHPPTMGYPP